MTELSTGRRLGRSIGIALFALVGVIYLSAGLVVPTFPWLVILNVIGAVAFVKTVQWSAERWWVALAGPVAALAFLFAYVNLGAWLFDWTA